MSSGRNSARKIHKAIGLVVMHRLCNLFLNLFLIATLVATQWGGVMHALAHAEYEIAKVLSIDGEGPGSPPPLDHSSDRCIAFHALDVFSSATHLSQAVPAGRTHCTAVRYSSLPAAPPTPFSARGPPLLA